MEIAQRLPHVTEGPGSVLTLSLSLPMTESVGFWHTQERLVFQDGFF